MSAPGGGAFTPGWSLARRRVASLSLAGVVVLVDQLTKTWALHHAAEPRHLVWTLRLYVTFNKGAAFGIGRGETAVLVLLAIVLVVVVVGVGRRASRWATTPSVAAMGLILGGALGNLSDRLLRHNHGAVIDFIDLRWWPVFNVADACITIGAVLLVLVSLGRRPLPPAAP